MNKLLFLIIYLIISHTECFANSCELAQLRLAKLASSSNVDSRGLIALMRKEANKFGSELKQAYCLEVLENIKDKESALNDGATFSESDLQQHLLLYEAFRLKTYLSSGVSPKRYFGFLDKKGDTSNYEQILREVTTQTVPLINQFAKSNGLNVQVSEKEIVLTFLAEGGALIMSDRLDKINRVHPITGIGLDNFRLGFARYPKLVEILDKQFKTRLASLTWNILGQTIILRPMTFREAILGTAIMYLFEKEITSELYQKSTNSQLALATLSKQFIYTSLVYNSGTLFNADRVEQISQFSTAEYLDNINQKNSGKRPALPIFEPKEIRRRLENGKPIPRQQTSWNAVYHILQRYGAWVALEKFSNAFNARGAFKMEK